MKTLGSVYGFHYKYFGSIVLSNSFESNLDLGILSWNESQNHLWNFYQYPGFTPVPLT